MTSTYTTADCVEEQLLESLKKRMADMESKLKDRLAMTEGGMESEEPKSFAYIDKMSEVSKSDSIDKPQFKKQQGVATGWSPQVTPVRKEPLKETLSMQNSNSRQFSRLDIQDNGTKDSKNFGNIIESNGVFTRGDLNKLKERLRKALPTQEEHPKLTLTNAFPFKAKDSASGMSEVKGDEPSKHRHYELFKTEPTSSRKPWLKDPCEPLQDISLNNPAISGIHRSMRKVESNIGLGFDSSGVLKTDDLRKFMSRTPSEDILSTMSYKDRMGELEDKISRLRKENHDCKGGNKKSSKSEISDYSQAKVKPNRHETLNSGYEGSRVLSSGLKSNLAMLMKPSGSVKIPAYLLANKVCRPSAAPYFHSSRKEPEPDLLRTPIKPSSHQMNRSGSLNFTAKLNDETPKQVSFKKQIAPYQSKALQKMNSLVDTFMKTKAYWDQAHGARSVDKKQKVR